MLQRKAKNLRFPDWREMDRNVDYDFLRKKEPSLVDFELFLGGVVDSEFWRSFLDTERSFTSWSIKKQTANIKYEIEVSNFKNFKNFQIFSKFSLFMLWLTLTTPAKISLISFTVTGGATV